MKTVKDDIWKYYNQGYWITITTNGFVKNNGECVMGRGIALQAKTKFPELPLMIGQAIHQYKNKPLVLPNHRLITFPVKHNWFEKADLELIEQSCKLLMVEVERLIRTKQLYKEILLMTKPGCHNGKLEWKDVEPILDKHFDERIIIVDWN